MRTLLIAGGALLALGLGALVYFSRTRSPDPIADPAPGPVTKEERDPLASFRPAKWKTTETKEEILKVINLPFLHRKFVGKRVNVVSFNGDGVEFTSPQSNYKNTTLTEGKAIFLGETGQLLRIELYSPNNSVPFPGQGTVEESEDRFRRSSENYESLPEGKPTLSFQDLLNCLYSRRTAQIEKSKRIEIIHIVHSQTGISDPQPLWAINCFGFPPYATFGLGAESVSADARSYLRYLVDASGKVLSADNQP